MEKKFFLEIFFATIITFKALHMYESHMDKNYLHHELTDGSALRATSPA
jgi:hypothetical protein